MISILPMTANRAASLQGVLMSPAALKGELHLKKLGGGSFI